MRITGIEELTKSRSKVYIDGEFAFVLYKGELRRFHMDVGEELSEEDHDVILGEILPKRAKVRAMNLLKKREYTTAGLRGKLEQGMYPEGVIEEALEYVASFHYTDDLRYATQYIICHGENRSRRRIEQDLQAKGIDRETFRAAWDAWAQQGGVGDESGMIRKLLTKRRYDPDTADYAQTRKQIAFLINKGFEPESIRRALKEYGRDVEELF
ncbi:MAG: RecX family transcriptional regulator [Clostridium sp.]|nr:RecX family transcriptional regulator [Acetatifactor muris]MCM1527750.1 RecX family transcriptional regulator [Bacteroides sp.]MCM1563720.1 RecX family transcriptional regulator [Clostridium sp.]